MVDHNTSDDTDDGTDTETVQRRSEVLFLYDAVDTVPNASPTGESNRQRIDPETREAIVTDVRLKRYIRDELAEKYNIYVRRPDAHQDAPQRDDLVKAVLPDDIKDRLKSLDDVDDDKQLEIARDVTDYFLSNAFDVRLFGATLSLERNDELAKTIADHLPTQFTGPVQFNPARSLNAPVQENENYNSLTSVIASDEDAEQGGYDLDDYRIKYAMFPFAGVINENAASDTHLTQHDIDVFDEVVWTALKNQTITRSKVGQQPRFYVRVEYDDENYHVGNLQEFLSVDDNHSAAPEDMRTIADMTVDMSDLVDMLERNQDRVRALHVNTDPRFTASVDDEVLDGGEIVEYFDTTLDTVTIEEIDA